MKLLTEIKVGLKHTNKDIFEAIRKKYGVFEHEIENFQIVRESLDCRKKPNIVVSYNIAVELKNSAKNKLKKCKLFPYGFGIKALRSSIFFIMRAASSPVAGVG